MGALPPCAASMPCVIAMVGAAIRAAEPDTPPPLQASMAYPGGGGSATAAGMSYPGGAAAAAASHCACAQAQSCLLTGASLLHEGRALDPVGTTVALLQLGHTAMCLCPQALADRSVLGAVVSLTVTACKTYDQEQCRAVLQWLPVLCCTPFEPPALAEGEPPVVAGRRQAWRELAASLDGGGVWGLGAGVELVLACLLAAGGDMPPDAIMPLATTLHAMWNRLGTTRCG